MLGHNGKYKLVALDVDGTLIDSNDRITDRTKTAVKEAVNKGIVVTLSTGRPVQSAVPLIEELEIDVPFIAYNGAMVVEGKNGGIFYELCIEHKDAREIYNMGLECGTTVMVWSKNRLYVNRIDERAILYGKQAITLPEHMSDPERVFKQGVTKILWYDEVEKINRQIWEMALKLKGDVNYHTSKPFYLEFVNKDVSKGFALKRIAEYFGVSREEIIAVGDGQNDLSMIEYAGLGIAMENSSELVKAGADYVTLSNDEDGVANVIEKFLL